MCFSGEFISLFSFEFINCILFVFSTFHFTKFWENLTQFRALHPNSILVGCLWLDDLIKSFQIENEKQPNEKNRQVTNTNTIQIEKNDKLLLLLLLLIIFIIIIIIINITNLQQQQQQMIHFNK